MPMTPFMERFPDLGPRETRSVPNTGVATLLNGHAPVMLGLAENDVPEPSTGVLLLSAIAALSLARRFSRRGSCVYRFRRQMASSV